RRQHRLDAVGHLRDALGRLHAADCRTDGRPKRLKSRRGTPIRRRDAMNSLSSIAMSGLGAAQLRLDASANNGANAATPGYRRQLVLQESEAGGGVAVALAHLGDVDLGRVIDLFQALGARQERRLDEDAGVVAVPGGAVAAVPVEAQSIEGDAHGVSLSVLPFGKLRAHAARPRDRPGGRSRLERCVLNARWCGAADRSLPMADTSTPQSRRSRWPRTRSSSRRAAGPPR